MPVFLYIAPWLELIFSLMGWGALIVFCWKRNWLLGTENMSKKVGITYSLGTGILFGLFLVGIIVGHFGLV